MVFMLPLRWLHTSKELDLIDVLLAVLVHLLHRVPKASSLFVLILSASHGWLTQYDAMELDYTWTIIMQLPA